MRRGGEEIVNSKSSIANAPGFTLIELLVVIGVLALLMGVLVPALGQARRAARSLVGGSRQRQIVLAANLYADRSPGPVSRVRGDRRDAGPHVAMAGAANDEGLPAAGRRLSVLHGRLPAALSPRGRGRCRAPAAPRPIPIWRISGGPATQWDNPDTGFTDDSVVGSFCFYWNYVGHLVRAGASLPRPADRRRPARMQPAARQRLLRLQSLAQPRGLRKLRASPPRRGHDRDRTRPPAYWFCKPHGTNRTAPACSVKLQAGFVDGHVEAYRPAETTILEVAGDLDGTTPAFSGLGPGRRTVLHPCQRSGIAAMTFGRGSIHPFGRHRQRAPKRDERRWGSPALFAGAYRADQTVRGRGSTICRIARPGAMADAAKPRTGLGPWDMLTRA